MPRFVVGIRARKLRGIKPLRYSRAKFIEARNPGEALAQSDEMKTFRSGCGATRLPAHSRTRASVLPHGRMHESG